MTEPDDREEALAFLKEHVETKVIPEATRTAERIAGERRRKKRIFWGIIIAFILLGLGIAAGSQINYTSHVASGKDKAEASATSNGAIASAQAPVISKANELAVPIAQACADPSKKTQLQKLGISCAQASAVATATPSVLPGVEGPAGQTGAQGSKGETGPAGPGLSDTQAQNAVNSFCSVHGCAPKLTPNEVAQALSLYCNANGQCRGPVGPTGSSGVNGTNGTNGQNATGVQGEPGVNGSDAPPPSQEQVTNGVNTFCNANPAQCQGPKGDTGAAGADPTDLEWVFTVPGALGVGNTTYDVLCTWSSTDKKYNLPCSVTQQ